MTRAALSVFSLVVGAVLTATIGASAGSSAPARHSAISTGAIEHVLAAITTSGAEVDERSDRGGISPEQVRERVRAGEKGTYIGDILLERDSSLARWADRDSVPLTVWIQPWSPVADFTPAYVERVREAFEAWDGIRLPVHFTFLDDSAAADVHVRWIDRFDEPISGRTRWARDDDWVITDANIVLAVHHHQGEILDEDAMHAMALHEIGHLLGLDHTRDSTSIMAPKVRVRRLSDADRSTIRLLHSLPAGPLR